MMPMPFARAPSLLAVFAAITTATSTARADVPVRWDCWLQQAGVDCAALESSYFDSIPWLRRRAGHDAARTLGVRVRSTEVPAGTSVRVDFAGPGEGPRFSLQELLRRDVDRDTALVRLVGLLQRGTVPFLALTEVGQTSDGAFHLDAIDPAGGAAPRHTRANATAARGWTLSPSVWAEIVQSGITLTAGGVDLSAAYSGAPWRLLASGGAAYRHLSLAIPGGNRIEGDVASGQARAIVARSIHGGLSVAAIGSVGHAPQDNLTLRAEGDVGVEWVLAPFLPASGNDFGVRYRVGLVDQRYVTGNVLGARAMLFTQHAATAFVRWHQDRVDVTTTGTAAAPIARHDLWEVRGGLTAAVRLTDAVQLEAEAEAALRGGSTNEPRDPDALDPAAALLGGSDFGRVSYVADLKLSYSFGNPLLEARDQRWRGTL